MKKSLSYQENSYFNSEDLYLFYNNLDFLIITKVHLYNGNWYSNHNNYKMTSVLCINYKELYQKDVKLNGTLFNGKLLSVDKVLPPYNVGVRWDIKGSFKGGIPYFWNDINNLNGD